MFYLLGVILLARNSKVCDNKRCKIFISTRKREMEALVKVNSFANIGFRLLAILALAGLWLSVAAPALADSPSTSSVDNGNLRVNVRLEKKAQIDSLALYDKNWKLLKEVYPSSADYTFHGLQVGGYHVVAYLDAATLGAKDEIAVQPGQTTYQELNTHFITSQKSSNPAALDWSNGYECVSNYGGGAKITGYCLGPVIGFGYFLSNPHNTYITYKKVCVWSGGGRSNPPVYTSDCTKVPVVVCIPGRCK
jgi:hypothetical protein